MDGTLQGLLGEMMMQKVQMCECVGGEEIEAPELWAALERVLEEHQGKPGALIRVLQKAQDLFGYLPRAVQERVAAGLGLPASEVFGVVSFYSYFTMAPRGKHTIRVCQGTACYVRGGKQVLDHLRAGLGVEVGSTTEDRTFSLEVVRCVGACGLAPVLTVGDDIYRRVKAGRLGELLAKYRNGDAG